MEGPELDVVVVGDGVAALALAAACRDAGLAVATVGPGAPWTATYATWRDDVPALPERCFGAVAERVVVHAHRRHVLERAYGVLDNAALRTHLAAGVDVRTGRATGVQHFPWGTRLLAGADAHDARLVVDATGRPSTLATGTEPAAWQSALGVVVAERPASGADPDADADGDGDAVTLMDLRPLAGAARPTFCYVVPVEDGWLVEETVLAARAAVPAMALRDPLERRTGLDAGRLGVGESVAIPMGGRLPSRRQPVVAFGAAAGFTHPATGFSVSASLRAAPRVADAIGAAVAGDVRSAPAAVWAAVWPPALRRTRRLHDHGLRVLLGLGPADLATFFDAFFDLPIDVWRPYLRIDSTPAEVSRTMVGVLRRVPGRLRWRLVGRPGGGR